MKRGPASSILLCVLAALAVVACLLKCVVEVRDHELAVRNPVALSDLDALGKRLDLAAKNQDPVQVDEAETANSSQPEAATPTPLPTRLARSFSTQEGPTRFLVTDRRDRLKMRAISTVLRIDDSISCLLGRRSRNGYHTSAIIGYDMMKLGRWKSARRYLWAAVDAYETTDPTQCKLALGALAWLEEDPEKAAGLLQLSCEGEFAPDGHGPSQ